jgi:hypothetical protein
MVFRLQRIAIIQLCFDDAAMPIVLAVSSGVMTGCAAVPTKGVVATCRLWTLEITHRLDYQPHVPVEQDPQLSDFSLVETDLIAAYNRWYR